MSGALRFCQGIPRIQDTWYRSQTTFPSSPWRLHTPIVVLLFLAQQEGLSKKLEPGGVFHFKAIKAIRGSVMHLIRLVFSHWVGSYLLYWHNCGVVTNSRQPTSTWPGFPAILQRRSGRNQLPGSYRTTQSGLTHSFHSLQIPQKWMDHLLEHCKGLDQQQGFTVPLTLLKALNSIPGRSSSMQV